MRITDVARDFLERTMNECKQWDIGLARVLRVSLLMILCAKCQSFKVGIYHYRIVEQERGMSETVMDEKKTTTMMHSLI